MITPHAADLGLEILIANDAMNNVMPIMKSTTFVASYKLSISIGLL